MCTPEDQTASVTIVSFILISKPGDKGRGSFLPDLHAAKVKVITSYKNVTAVRLPRKKHDKIQAHAYIISNAMRITFLTHDPRVSSEKLVIQLKN
jgi:hypothetical protein